MATPTTSTTTADAAGRPRLDPGVPIGRLEGLPTWLARAPVAAHWLWLALRHGSMTLPSCANPAITTGGLVGEGKLEYLGIMGEHALTAIAPTAWLPCGGPQSAAEAEAAMHRIGIKYPVVLKPDLGVCGFGVRRVDTRAQLADYFARFPRGERILIQPYIAHEGDAGLFYMRVPGEARGRLIGLMLRHGPKVIGDGVSTLAELVAANERLQRLGRDGASEPLRNASSIPAKGEEVRLATVGSSRVGGSYEDGSPLITPALTRAIDDIARNMENFHVGRFDVKFDSLSALRAGHGFSIVEVNGAGSKAVHAWDPTLSLREAYRILFDKQRLLFAIGREMRRRGHRPVGLLALARHHLNQRELISQYPPSN